MKAAFIRIAQGKATGTAVLSALDDIRQAAQAFEEAEATFPARIAALKAPRGESPVKLSAARRAQLAELDADRIAMDADLLRQLEAPGSAREVIESLHFGLSLDIPSARSLLKHCPPDDRPLMEELVVLKETLLARMAGFLEAFPE
ncbi:hypothetical protein [Pseudomonas indica]|uniref:hypothetical protein n=1 Tax=Pseudomonas indica TaxID=137658 RepID=UPI0023F71ED5|nr:hypothetical protein [Pseudomonas indica]MBU3055934.1 hypothetical protein [Pseudomonas indica]